ncbi:hypothetical protein ScPMuIL_013633 [Solemya velum]
MKIVIFLATLTTVLTARVQFKDCGSVGATINWIDINTCTSEPCPLPRNKNITVDVNFAAKEDVSSANNKVYGIIGGVPIAFPVQPDACKDMPCPITSGQTVSYKNEIHVLSSYPKIRVVVQWEVVDSSGNMVFCFQVPAQITD